MNFETIIGKVKKFLLRALEFLGVFIVALPEIFKHLLKKLKYINHKKLLICVSIGCILLISAKNDIAAISADLFSKLSYTVIVDNQSFGKFVITDDTITEEMVLEEVGAVLAEENGVPVFIKASVELLESTAHRDEITELSEIAKKIAKVVDYDIEVFQLYVDGESVGFLRNDEEIKIFLEDFKNQYAFEGMESIEFVEDIQLNKAFLGKDDLSDYDEIIEVLSGNKVDELRHVIVQGDTLWDLAIDNEVTLEDLYYSNPGLTEDTLLMLDSEIVIITPVPFISVRTLEKVTYEAVAEREVEFIENNEEFRTYREVIVEGSDGKKTVTANLVRTNGLETDRLILEEVIIVEPVSDVVEIGTLNLPPKKAIGSFIFPTTGRISDRFGTRSYGHTGIDIANSAGTRINASDGGLVTYSGWMGNYGNVVIIDHQNGYETYYAHNSSNMVRVGEMVAQGQQIAKMGTTGRSTGNHLHFEVRLNKVPKNPFDYVQY